MEMRAGAETGLGRDLTPPLPPLAAALHDPFLPSRCSACFRNLPSSPLACDACDGLVRYCSAACSAADSLAHTSSGECRLLRCVSSGHCPSTAELRAALRLLRTFSALGLLSRPRRTESQPRRIGGLLASGLEKVLDEGGELAERIREGGSLMACARDGGEKGRGVEEEVEVLWTVLTNAVEVQVSEGAAVGVAVYGPAFSWFNHSCAPNACYRFELVGARSEPLASCDKPGTMMRVSPAGQEEEKPWMNGASGLDHGWCRYGPRIVVRSIKPIRKGEEVCIAYTDLLQPKEKPWMNGASGLDHGWCRYGPRIVVRSIKPIRKGEEVCIAYTDLLQPKAVRHSVLWSKYRFICCCKRCNSSLEMRIDYILNCDARGLNLNNCHSGDAELDELADIIDQAILVYTSDENAEACCNMLENMLSESSKDNRQFQAGRPLEQIKLHPLHYLCLTAYITVASAYRTLANSLHITGMDEVNSLEAFKMGRAAAAYSLLLAGATHHLFLSEISLIVTTTHYLVNAGESILALVRSSMWGSKEQKFESECRCISEHSWRTTREDSLLSLDELMLETVRFLGCVSGILLPLWPLLVRGFSYLETVYNPVDFSWLGIRTFQPDHMARRRDAIAFKTECIACKHGGEMFIEEERKGLYLLAVHCLVYGRHLASICYGPQSYLYSHVTDLLTCMR